MKNLRPFILRNTNVGLIGNGYKKSTNLSSATVIFNRTNRSLAIFRPQNESNAGSEKPHRETPSVQPSELYNPYICNGQTDTMMKNKSVYLLSNYTARSIEYFMQCVDSKELLSYFLFGLGSEKHFSYFWFEKIYNVDCVNLY